jgi:hypothetical protein
MKAYTNSVFTEIEIKAKPEEVWDVLTDWKNLKEWSSSFIGISVKEMKEGESFMVYFKNPLNNRIIEFERKCLAYEEHKKFSWTGEFRAGVSDYHIYEVESTENGITLFKQSDGIHGSHSGVLNLLGKKHMKAMYEKFNRELKERVESINNQNKG